MATMMRSLSDDLVLVFTQSVELARPCCVQTLTLLFSLLLLLLLLLIMLDRSTKPWRLHVPSAFRASTSLSRMQDQADAA